MTSIPSTFFFETVRILYLVAVFALCMTCVFTANRMSGDTCNCQKAWLILILIGATMQFVLALSSVMTVYGMMAGIPVSLGFAIKLATDRRQRYCETQHERA
jgi:Flp pilus assembly protein TadB